MKAMVLAPAGAVGLEPVLDILGDRVGADVGEQPLAQARRLEVCQGLPDHRQLGEAGIRHQQRLLHADRLAGLRQLGDAADAEAHGCGVVPVGAKLLGFLFHAHWG
jgi:hypothetical protein